MGLPPGIVIAVGAYLAAGTGLLLTTALLGPEPDRLLQIVLGQAAVALPVLALLLPLRPRHLGLGPVGARPWFAGAAWGLPAYGVSLACLFALVLALGPPPTDQPVERILAEVHARIGLPGLLLVAAVLPGLVEEALFRGVILTGLRRHLPAWAAVLLAAALFALLHLDRWRLLPQFALGVLCGYLALRHRSCWPAAAAHAVHNACVLIGARALAS